MNTTTKGTLLAMTAASLLVSGTIFTVVADDSTTKKEMVKCNKGNACQGKSACNTAHNSCKGQNACKGKGWVTMTVEECKKVGGVRATQAEETDESPD